MSLLLESQSFLLASKPIRLMDVITLKPCSIFVFYFSNETKRHKLFLFVWYILVYIREQSNAFKIYFHLLYTKVYNKVNLISFYFQNWLGQRNIWIKKLRVPKWIGSPKLGRHSSIMWKIWPLSWSPDPLPPKQTL